MAESALRPEWELFVNEYLVDLNATKAAKRAGFGNTEEALNVTGSRLLRNAKVKRAIRKEFKKRLARIKLTQDQVLKELALIGLSDVMDYEVNEATGRLVVLKNKQSSKAVQSIKVKKRTWIENDEPQSEVTIEYKLWDKLKALEMMMRHMGMLDGDDGKQSKPIEQRRNNAIAQLGKLLEQRRTGSN